MILAFPRGRPDMLAAVAPSAQTLEQLQVVVDHPLASVFADNSLADCGQSLAWRRMDQHFEHGLTQLRRFQGRGETGGSGIQSRRLAQGFQIAAHDGQSQGDGLQEGPR
jgi:hypothetical protein